MITYDTMSIRILYSYNSYHANVADEFSVYILYMISAPMIDV